MIYETEIDIVKELIEVHGTEITLGELLENLEEFVEITLGGI